MSESLEPETKRPAESESAPKSPLAVVYECAFCTAVYVLRSDDDRRECKNRVYGSEICCGRLIEISPARLRSVFIELNKVEGT
jgi:hypothetical protein